MTNTPKTLSINNYFLAQVKDGNFDLHKGNPSVSCVRIGKTTYYYDIDSSFSDKEEFEEMVKDRFEEQMKFYSVKNMKTFTTSKGAWWVSMEK